MRSIRTRLLVWLVAALFLCGAALVGTIYRYAVSEFDSVADEELKHIAYALQLNGNGPETQAFREENPEFLFATRGYGPDGRMVFEGGLIGIRFTGPASQSEGYSDAESAGRRWRVFTHALPDGAVQVAQPEDVRRALARDLAFRMVRPVGLAIPVIALLVWWLLARGLHPLRAASELVRRRAPGFLEPLPRGDEPQELVPLLDAIDDLIHRVSDALEAQRRFVADAAHELRSPLTALKLQVQLAERAAEGVEREAAIRELRFGVERGAHLVEQLLSLARADRPAQAGEACDLAALARDVVADFARRAEAMEIDLGAEATGEVRVSADREALRPLVSNLVDNALRYTPRLGTVTVKVTLDNRVARLEVVDSGPGIPPTERARVFERFYRGSAATAEGTGLGLAIVKAVADRYGATVTLTDAAAGREPPGLRAMVDFPAAV